MPSACAAGPQALEHISEAQAAPFLARVIGCYSSLVELENFAVMNYAGCGKILKKHDKVTGFTTKAQYMAKVVDRLEWASYPRLLKMLEHVDGIYRLVLSKLATDTRARFLGSQEQSRLVSLGDMKRVASSEKLAVMASAATGLDAAAAAAARTHMVIPGSTGGSAAAPAGPMSVTQRTAELQRRAAGDQSDSDDDEPDREAATASAAGPTSPGAPQTRVTPDDRRQTELDIAAFIAGVARTPMHGAGLADPARHRSSSVPVAPAFVASLPMRAPTTIVPPTVGFPSPVPSMPASSSSSSSSSAAAAASAAGLAARLDLAQAAPPAAASVSGAGPALHPAAHGRLTASLARAGLSGEALPLVAAACSVAPGLAPDYAAQALRQQPHVASDGPRELARVGLAIQHAAHMHAAGGHPFGSHGVAVLPFSGLM